MAVAPLYAQTGPARPPDEIPQRIDKERAESRGGKSDWERQQEERDFKEADLPLPALPDKQALIEFFVTSASSFHFFIDATSLSVGPDGVVRYTLVARSPSGYENISYEGIRCESGTVKIFAFANDGQWKRSNSEWQPIEAKSVQRWHNVLRGQFFCPNRATIASAAEGLDALRRGQHPAVRNTGI
ncbi:MAG TPA: CNP1-like family protein [Burkholderiales bacterium]|nr:CNP1-like family protein [Burkholderiales bacterium]